MKASNKVSSNKNAIVKFAFKKTPAYNVMQRICCTFSILFGRQAPIGCFGEKIKNLDFDSGQRKKQEVKSKKITPARYFYSLKERIVGYSKPFCLQQIVSPYALRA